MKKTFLLVFCILFLSFCSFPHRIADDFISWTNNTVDTLLFFNDTVSSYQLKPKYQKMAVSFSSQEKALQPKGETYGYAMNSVNGQYYTVATHKDKYGYDYKLITYSIRGENDTEILVSQLNSYKKDMPIDGLVLEMNFTFETKCFARYVINESIIKIDRYEINGILYTENGEIVGMKDTPDTIVHRSVYKMKDGRFVKAK